MTKSDEGETYASTTASPPPVQISLDDSIEAEYKDSRFINEGGLISPNTDFSEEVCASLQFYCLKHYIPSLSTFHEAGCGIVTFNVPSYASYFEFLGRILQGCK